MSNFSFLDLLIVLLRNKVRIALHFFLVIAAAIAISYIIPKSYKATVLFFPPQDEGATLPTLAMGFNLNLGGQSDFTPQQIYTLLDSRVVMETIVRQFDLMKVYKTEKYPNNMELAVKSLRSNLKLKTQIQTGFAQEIIIHFSLSVIDKDGERAAAIANAIVDLLNRTMERLSSKTEGYAVAFIKSRLDSVEATKDSVMRVMADYQKLHKIYSPDMKEQVQASVGIFAELKKQKMLAEIERDLLLLDNEKDSREVKFSERRISQLDKNMKRLENGQVADALPALYSSVDVGHRYLELMRESEIQMKLEVLLRQQYEEARIKNARRAPVVRIVDPAVPPQWKNSPKKAIVVLVIVGVYMFILLIYVMAQAGVRASSLATQRKVEEFKAALRFEKAGQT